jgi:alpha-tubulin suppressor-like RCC1 family protein
MLSTKPTIVTSYKVLGQSNPVANILTDVYSTSFGLSASISTIAFCNQSSTEITFSAAIKPNDVTLGPEHYILYNAVIPAFQTLEVKGGLTLKDSTLVVETPSDNLSVSVFGFEYYTDLNLSLDLSTIFDTSETLDRIMNFNRVFEDQYEFTFTYQNEPSLDFSSEQQIFDIFNTYNLDLDDIYVIEDSLAKDYVYIINLDEDRVLISEDVSKEFDSVLSSNFELFDSELFRFFDRVIVEDTYVIEDSLAKDYVYIINLDEDRVLISEDVSKEFDSVLSSNFELFDVLNTELFRFFERVIVDDVQIEDTFEKQSLFFLEFNDSNEVSSSTTLNISSLFLLNIEELISIDDQLASDAKFFLNFDSNYGFIDTNIGKTTTSIVSENISVLDEFERVSQYIITPTETIVSQDLGILRDHVINLSDVFTSIDEVSKSLTAIQTESVTLTDTNVENNLNFIQSSTVEFNDSLSKLPTIVVADSYSTAEDFVVNTEFVIVDDTITFTDANFIKALDQNLSDIANINDSNLSKLFVTNYTDSFTEVDVGIVKNYNSVSIDSLSLTDANFIKALDQNLSDIANINDSNLSKLFVTRYTDTFTEVDVGIVKNYNSVSIDSSTLTDTNFTKNYFNQIADSIVFVDSFSDIQELTLANSFDITDSLATTLVVKVITILYTWGRNTNGQLGDGTTTQRNSPSLLSSDYWAKISGGLFYSIGTKEDNKLFAWGANGAAQLGDGTKTQRTSPVAIGSFEWIEISAGQEHTAAIRSDGLLFAWGRNTYGQLGDGTTVERLSPVQIGTDTWLKVETGADHTIAIRSDGKLFAWGRNLNGQLGDGTTTNRTTPTQIGVSNWKSISSNSPSNLAIRSDDKLFAWGRNLNGQLGDGTTTQRNSPVQIGTSNWKKISISTHSLAIRSDDKLFAWGSNTYGQVGDGTTTQRNSPVQIGTSNWKEISVGSLHSLAIRSDDKLFAWGNNFYGQLGDGTTTQRTSPRQIGTSDWVIIHAGGDHSLGLLNSFFVDNFGELTLSDNFGMNDTTGFAYDPAAGVDEAIAVLSLTSPYISAYPFSEYGFGTKYADPTTSISGDMYTVDFARAGNAIVMGHDFSPYVTAYEWNITTGFGAKYSNPAVLPTSITVSSKFSYESNAIGLMHLNSPYISVYRWNSATGFGTKYSAPSFTADSGEAIEFKPGLVAFTFDPPGFGTSSAPGVRVYDWTAASGFGTKYADPVGYVIFDGIVYNQIVGFDVEFNYNSGDIRPESIFVGGGFSSAHGGGLIGYPWSSSGFGTKYSYTNITIPSTVWNMSIQDNKFAMFANKDVNYVAVHRLISTGWATQYTSPIDLPFGVVQFNSNGSKLAIAGNRTPYIHVYNFASAGFGTKYSSPSILPNGTSLGTFNKVAWVG